MFALPWLTEAAIATGEELAPLLGRQAVDYAMEYGIGEEVLGLGGLEAYETASRYIGPIVTGLLGIGATDFVYQRTRNKRKANDKRVDTNKRGSSVYGDPIYVPADDTGYEPDRDGDDYDDYEPWHEGDDYNPNDDTLPLPENPNDETLPLPNDGTDNNTHVFILPQQLANINKMTENRKFAVPPIRVRHHSNYRKPFGIKPLILSGYRTYEMTVDGGKLALSDEFRWNDKDDIKRQMDISIRNYFQQNQVGYRSATNEGISGVDLNNDTITTQIYSYCLNHKKEYIVTNQGTTNCLVICSMITNKKEGDVTFDDAVGDSSFETRQSPEFLQYTLGTSNELTNVIPSDDYRFNFFKHRYRVRKDWKLLGKRTVQLAPGDTVVIPVIDSGPWLFSRIALDESVSALIPGYYRQVVFELRGTDVAFSKSTTDYKTGFAKAGINIIEKTTMTLMSYPIMRTRKMVFATTAETDNSVTIGSYRKAAFLTDDDMRIINNDDKVSKPMDQGDDTTNTTNQ